MPYDLSLAPDLDRGGHRYRAELSGELESAAVRRLSEWIEDAKLNPDARFVIDLSQATRSTRRARLELRALLRRHADLLADRRLSVLEPARGRRQKLAAAVSPMAVAGLVERALATVDSAPVPL